MTWTQTLELTVHEATLVLEQLAPREQRGRSAPHGVTTRYVVQRRKGARRGAR